MYIYLTWNTPVKKNMACNKYNFFVIVYTTEGWINCDRIFIFEENFPSY